MLENIDNSLDKSQNSFIHDAVAGTALELASFYMKLEHTREKFNIYNLNGEDLDEYIYPRSGLKRRDASPARTAVVITGEESTTIHKGILVSSGDVDYEVLEQKVIDDSGEALVEVQAVESGSIGNAPTRAISEFPVAISGLVSVSNPEEVTNGYDAEDDNTYRERHLEKVRTPATSGNKYHYSIWAKEVIGVGDARIDSLWAGDNTVKITIINSNKKPGDEDLIAEVQEHIDPGSKGLGEGQAPIGAFATVVSAKGKTININAHVVVERGDSLEEVNVRVKRNISDYLKEVAFQESTVSYARIGAVILSTESVVDYSELTINGGTIGISIEDDEVAVLGGVELID